MKILTDVCPGKPWISWAALGLKVASQKHSLSWRNCTDITHAWTGLVILKPGQAEPLHKHTTPMFYYILQVSRKWELKTRSLDCCPGQASGHP